MLAVDERESLVLLLLGPRETSCSQASDVHSKPCADNAVTESCLISVGCQFSAVIASSVQIE